MGKIEDLIGKQFGIWKVLGPISGRNVLCECQCKNKTTKMVGIYHLTSGLSKSCGHCNSVIYTIGDKVEHFTILKVLPDYKYVCQCDCDRKTELVLTDRDLKRKKSCGCAHGSKGKRANNFIDMKGIKINEWEFIEYVGNNKWRVKCSCNREFIRNGESIRNGISKSCGHGYNEFIDISEQLNGCFKAKEYIGRGIWKCECQLCGKLKNIERKDFQECNLDCNHKNSDGTVRIKKLKHSDYKGQIFGCWQVLDYISGGTWKCKCLTCGKERIISTYRLGHSDIKCDHIIINVGDIFNNWEVTEVIGDNHIKCKCNCGCDGNTSILSKYDIINGKSKSCGFNTNLFKDISGHTFGNWKVIKYCCNGYWECECQCESKTIRYIHTYSLRSGNSKSCGCLKRYLSIESKIRISGEITKCKLDEPRELWQIQTINDKDKLKNYIENSCDITVAELAESLRVTYSTLLQRLKKFNLTSLVPINRGKSLKEKHLREYISSIYSGEIVIGDRKVLSGKELDIYMPDLKLAIEFNGTYWHSDNIKDRDYHKLKTIDCAKQGIQLIHIFEYEWDNSYKQSKIKDYLYNAINGSANVIYARNTDVLEISDKVAAEFIDKYHLQGSESLSKINFGCYYNNELVGVMTFGKTRFSNEYEYEILRFAWKTNIRVVGGSSKLFSKFVSNYNPKSVITYSDMAKFTGNSYIKMGFKPLSNPFSEPNYVWANSNNDVVLSRYQTQKHELVEKGLGTHEQTEDEIMKAYNFLKIYDSGNLRLEWHSEHHSKV